MLEQELTSLASRDKYAHASEHLNDELSRLDLMLERERAPIDQEGGANKASSDESERPLNGESVRSRRELIEARVQASFGRHLPLARLREVFALSRLEYEILLICLAPALSPRYSGLYATLQNDPERPCATPGLAARLLEESGFGVAALREACSAHAPLLRYGLLKFKSAPGDFTLLSRPLVADERIVDYALGGAYLDSSTAGMLFGVQADETHTTIAREVVGETRLAKIAGALGRAELPGLLYLQGDRDAPFLETAAVVCRENDLPLLRLEFARLALEAREKDPHELLRRCLREALLFGGALLVEDFDRFGGEGHDRLREYFLREIERMPGLFFVAGSGADLRGIRADRVRFMQVSLAVPDSTARERIWSDLFARESLAPDGISVGELAGAFRFNARQIERALARARDAHRIATGSIIGDNDDAPAASLLPLQALLEGCRAESNRRLSELAVRVPTKFGWGDIVLPRDSFQQLREIEAHVRHARVVYEAWGFEQQVLAGRGLNVLFSGPSGTGKTMAASILAGELKLELFKVDLSTVVSKYIGETEKNLGRIFDEAETSNAVLFFDEADALFGKRSEVKDAHDRNANIEVGYLLQKMEEYSGISILATNLRENIDEAFLRRLHSIVEFPFPGPPERERIWRIALPHAAPRADDIDFKFLAERIKLAGGGIKNVVLGAAFIAADEGQVISMSQLVRSARREYQKDGRNLLPSDLGPYVKMLEENREEFN